MIWEVLTSLRHSFVHKISNWAEIEDLSQTFKDYCKQTPTLGNNTGDLEWWGNFTPSVQVWQLRFQWMLLLLYSWVSTHTHFHKLLLVPCTYIYISGLCTAGRLCDYQSRQVFRCLVDTCIFLLEKAIRNHVQFFSGDGSPMSLVRTFSFSGQGANWGPCNGAKSIAGALGLKTK